MDFEKYYKIDYDGSYNLHFLNKDKLTVDEIKNIFSTYGKVLNVNITKDEGGLRFVKYRTYQEAMCCWRGLQNSKIQLLPERNKINLNKKDCNQQQSARTGNSFKKPINDYKQLNSNSINDENLSNRKSSTHIKTFQNGFDNFSDTNYENSMCDHKPIQSGIKDDEQHSSVFNGRSSLPSKQTFIETNSLDTTIDYEKYYRISRDDTYTVHFANKKGLTSEQIKELFSPYGNIVSIHSRGENNGLKFVRYKTLEEVISCLKGLQFSNLVSLLPQKNKIMGETKSIDQSSNQWQAAKTEDTSQKTFSTGKQFNLNSTYNENNGQKNIFLENKEKPIYNTNIPDQIRDKFEDNNFSDTSSVNSKQNFNSNGTKHKNTSSQMFNEKCTSSRQRNPINYKGHNKTMGEKQQETKFSSSIMTETDTKMDRNMRISTHDYKMPALISDTEMKSDESDAMSNSSLSNKTKKSLSKIVFIPMQEIIVANIHSKYGVHYILHLFEKYSPISATLVKTIPETNLRYCHIYFKSAQDAEAVEEEFDNFDLFGKNLIVLRKSRLLDETK